MYNISIYGGLYKFSLVLLCLLLVSFLQKVGTKSGTKAHKSMKVTEHYYATYDKTSLDDAMARAFG